MANEITYKVVEIIEHRMKVQYTMGEAMIEMTLDWDGVSEPEQIIKNFTPRAGLLGMQPKPPLDQAVMGLSGSTDLKPPPPPVQTIEPIPPAAPADPPIPEGATAPAPGEPGSAETSIQEQPTQPGSGA